MKRIAIFLVFILLSSCKYFTIESKQTSTEKPIASVYDAHLYLQDIRDLQPKNVSSQDSLVMTKSIINSWAKEQLLLKKALENISEADNKKIENLVRDYKQSLYINDYKTRLIKQQLDTIVNQEEIDSFYIENKSNFRLDKNLFKVRYVHFGRDFLDKKEVIKRFKSQKEADLDSLESKTINFKGSNFDLEKWFTYDNLVKAIPPFQAEPKEKLLKLSKFIQKEDSLGVYLVAVKDFLKKNAIAPQNYIEANIKEIILHKRKLELIRDIEKTLINDAIENQKFKEY